MTYVPTLVPELAIIGVVDPGVPNKERVILRPTQPVQLGGFGILAGQFNPTAGNARPIFDRAFWFPDKAVQPPAWLIIFTGSGEPKEIAEPGVDPTYTFFWQRKETLFENSGVVPIVMRIGGAVIGPRL